jgi:hypothetical protein
LLARLVVVALLATLAGLVLMAAVLAALTRILRLLSGLLTALVLAALVLLAALILAIHFDAFGLSGVLRQPRLTTDVPMSWSATTGYAENAPSSQNQAKSGRIQTIRRFHFILGSQNPHLCSAVGRLNSPPRSRPANVTIYLGQMIFFLCAVHEHSTGIGSTAP